MNVTGTAIVASSTDWEDADAISAVAYAYHLPVLRIAGPEPVKPPETRLQDFFCASLWMVGLLIHATVGSFGGAGRRPQNRRGLAA